METQPNAVDWTTVLLAVISLIGTIVTAFLAFLAQRSAGEARSQSKATASAVDGVKVELVEAVRGRAQAEGKAEGLATGLAIAGTAPAPPPAPAPDKGADR